MAPTGYVSPAKLEAPRPTLDAAVHRGRPRGRDEAVVYLHGGGLLYGGRDDLPARYLRLLTDSGRTVYCLDYPLAPEATVSEMVDVLVEAWERLTTGRPTDRWVLAGRSSGAYLAFLLAREVRKRNLRPCDALLDFYGYWRMDEPFATEPAHAFCRLPEVPWADVAGLTGAGPLTEATPQERYPLYVHARQTGRWAELLGVDGAKGQKWSLSEEDVLALPPLFCAASTGDQEVPYRLSKRLKRMRPDTKLVTVYHLPHDFDRDLTNPAGAGAWGQAVSWLDGLAATG